MRLVLELWPFIYAAVLPGIPELLWSHLHENSAFKFPRECLALFQACKKMAWVWSAFKVWSLQWTLMFAAAVMIHTWSYCNTWRAGCVQLITTVVCLLSAITQVYPVSVRQSNMCFTLWRISLWTPGTWHTLKLARYLCWQYTRFEFGWASVSPTLVSYIWVCSTQSENLEIALCILRIPRLHNTLARSRDCTTIARNLLPWCACAETILWLWEKLLKNGDLVSVL